MIEIFVDGACYKGGTISYAYIIYRDMKEIARKRVTEPGVSHNVAEYRACIEAVKWLVNSGIHDEKIVIKSDSQLLIKQLRGKYSVRAPNLYPLHVKLKSMLKDIGKIDFVWIPRKENVAHGVTEGEGEELFW